MPTKYETEATKIKNALDAVYENKQTNKKNDISGDYSSDNVSYPTVKAVKTELANKISKSTTAGLVKNDGTIDTTNYSTFSGDYDDLTDKPSIPVDVSDLTDSYDTAFTPKSHSHGAGDVTDSTAHSNIGTLANATQAAINAAIDTQLGSFLGIDLVTVVSQLPTASADTMNKLYMVAEDTSQTQDNYKIYVTVRTGTSPNYSYDWEKVDSTRIDLTDYVQKSSTSGLLKNDGTVDTTSYSTLTTSDVDTEVESYLDALAEAINPSSP